MNTPEIQRKAKIAYLNARICLLDWLMRQEANDRVTHQWKRLAQRQGQLIQQRNHLRTPAEIAKIEKRRGLS